VEKYFFLLPLPCAVDGNFLLLFFLRVYINPIQANAPHCRNIFILDAAGWEVSPLILPSPLLPPFFRAAPFTYKTLVKWCEEVSFAVCLLMKNVSKK
jgi:hypothetical protein